MDGKSAEAKEGKPFFLYLPYTSPHYPVCPLPEFHGQGEAGAYGEFVIETDHHIGRILTFLKEAGLDDNTLIVYTSDNGPENSWTGRLEEFGHDSRGGHREGKRSVYEGGHRVPFLVRWPAGIKEPGRSWGKVVGQTDLLATFAELMGKELPANAGEDSQSFASVLKDPKHDYDRLPLISHGNGGRQLQYAITEGDWKLVMSDGKHASELYNLTADRAEKKNVSKEHPEITKRLTKEITKIVAQGRTTPGGASPNDTGYWSDLKWMSEAEYDAAQ
jgi:arylsulfatase A